MKKLKSIREFKIEDNEGPEKKRDKKYLSKFSYRTKLISRKCPSGMMLGTPSFADKKGQRAILKYLKKDVVGLLPNTL